MGKKQSTPGSHHALAGRNPTIDSIKGLLIVLVVFGHLIETSPGTLGKAVYAIIYSFHMPFFVVLAGMYWKPSLEWIKKRNARLLIIYCVAEAAYTLFKYINTGKIQSIFTPYWVMWFLMSLMFWNLLMLGFKNNVLMVIPAIVISIASGACGWLGYPFSAQRTFHFLPFFVGGYFLYSHRQRLAAMLTESSLVPVLVLLGLVVVFAFTGTMNLPRGLLYGSYSYQSLGLTFLQGASARAMLLALSTLTIAFILILWIRLRITILSTLGNKTLNIYIMHGFIVLTVRKYLQLAEPQSLLIYAALSLSMAFAFSRVRWLN